MKSRREGKDKTRTGGQERRTVAIVARCGFHEVATLKIKRSIEKKEGNECKRSLSKGGNEGSGEELWEHKAIPATTASEGFQRGAHPQTGIFIYTEIQVFSLLIKAPD